MAEDKKIDWSGTIGVAIFYLLLINGFILLLWNVFDYSSKIIFADMETHIIFSVIYLIAKLARGDLVVYEGWYEAEEHKDSDYYKPEKNIRRFLLAIVVLLIFYIMLN